MKKAPGRQRPGAFFISSRKRRKSISATDPSPDRLQRAPSEEPEPGIREDEGERSPSDPAVEDDLEIEPGIGTPRITGSRSSWQNHQQERRYEDLGVQAQNKKAPNPGGGWRPVDSDCGNSLRMNQERPSKVQIPHFP